MWLDLSAEVEEEFAAFRPHDETILHLGEHKRYCDKTHYEKHKIRILLRHKAWWAAHKDAVNAARREKYACQKNQPEKN